MAPIKKKKRLYVSLNLKVKLYVEFSDTTHRKKNCPLRHIYIIKIYIFCFNLFSIGVLNA
jgi:hypothetical protein